MQWYDFLVIFLGIIGMILVLFGSYSGHGIKKSGVIGWIILVFLLIVRILIWLMLSVFKQ